MNNFISNIKMVGGTFVVAHVYFPIEYKLIKCTFQTMSYVAI